MPYLQLFGLLLLGFVVWRIAHRFVAGSSPLAHVAGPAKEHWLKGNYHRIFQDGLDYNLQLQERYGGAVKIHSMLGSELLYVSDPRALHHIVVKDQHIYDETDMFIMGNKLIFGEGLISTLGEQHRKQRKILNPVFSLANMRDLLPVIQPISDKLRAIFVAQLPPDGGTKEINVLPWMSRGALEYIGQAALDHSFNALDTSKHEEYTEVIRNLGPTVLRLLLFRPFVPAVVRTFSLYWRNKIVDWAPLPALRELRHIVRVMDAASRRILAEKRAAMSESGKVGKGKDVMSIMLRANAASSAAERLTEEEILGQMNTFIFAGFENTATALSRLLYTLAKWPEAQARLRSEIRAAKRAYRAAGGDAGGAASPAGEEDWRDVELPYDVLMGLPYLDAVVRETFRVHPPSSLFGRVLRKATTLPLEYPVRLPSGAMTSSIPLRENTTIIISILAANHNKKVWGEDASEWKPERWLESAGVAKDADVGEEISAYGAEAEGAPGSKNGVKYPGVYASMMTFLGGSRACIGFKFAEMELKQVATTLLSYMHFSLPSSADETGNKKEIYWKITAMQVPVVRAPAGDNQTPQVPLDVRLVRQGDFA